MNLRKRGVVGAAPYKGKRSFIRKELSQLDFLKNIANLLKVKTIVTLAVMAVFSTLAMKGTITADNVMIVVSTVIAFYFGTQHEK